MFWPARSTILLSLLLGLCAPAGAAAAAVPDRLDAESTALIHQSVDQLKASLQEDGDYRPGTPEDDVRWMDGFLEKRSADWRQYGANLAVANAMAFWLGDVVAAQTGGHWATLGGQPVLQFANGQLAYPHNKILRRVQYGPRDSLLEFYRVSVAVARGEPVRAPERSASPDAPAAEADPAVPAAHSAGTP